MDKIVELSVENFKAVKKADITLNGITVVSGINGCGKSSLSQLLYYSFYYANAYEEIANYILNQNLSCYTNALKQIEHEIKYVIPDGGDFYDIYHASVKDIDCCLRYIKQLFSRFLSYRDIVNEVESNDGQNSLKRVIRIIRDTLQDKSQNDLDKLLDIFYNHIEVSFMSALAELEQRDYELLEDYLSFYMKRALPEKWTICEYGVPFAGNNTSDVPILHYIKRVAYIDTPMIVGNQFANGREKDYWKNLMDLLNNDLHIDGSLSLNKNLSQIINGESMVEEDGIRNSKLSYRRDDGKIFDLKDCATGIKSFSILQLLLKNGFLQKDTLLIIDEPEAHLHPQWIVEYARMIVMLHKEIGMKFFIASHSTDMVSAIRYIAAKEEVQDSLNFYLAEDSEDAPHEYTYRDLKLDIDPIFKSFNKSFDKLDEYGMYD
ncbi:AAA family ATPase [uncultured Bacteroides sp.]|uniref:AAA family ATPase n=1 Tax=uncultured Bacteroides sp. TaxID=162156 RepID=UPI0025F35879|nr:AAA family ATPase [uncultured Bacteroides sp.]